MTDTATTRLRLRTQLRMEIFFQSRPQLNDLKAPRQFQPGIAPVALLRLMLVIMLLLLKDVAYKQRKKGEGCLLFIRHGGVTWD